jgi:hypothetical protein
MLMNFDWQSWAALAVVLATVAIFVARAVRSRKKGSACGGGCGCSPKIKAKPKTIG